MWFHPRQTIQAIVDVNPLHRIYLLVLLSEISYSIPNCLYAVMTDSDTWQENALLTMGYGLVTGPALTLASCLILQWIAGRSGDGVAYSHLVAARFWGTIPAIGFQLVFIVIFVGKTLALMSYQIESEIIVSIEIVLQLASLLSQIWSVVLTIGALAQVMRCPVITVFGRGIVAGLILAVPSWALTRLFSYFSSRYSGDDIVVREGDAAATNLASIAVPVAALVLTAVVLFAMYRASRTRSVAAFLDSHQDQDV